MRRLLLVWIAVVAGVGVSVAQTIITQWNFNGASAGSAIPSTGSGVISVVGGVTQTFASGTSNSGSSDPSTSFPPNYAYNTDGYPASTTGDKTAGIRFAVSTVGYKDISVSFDTRHSNTASNEVILQYSLDGMTWIDAPGGTFNAASGDTWFKNRTVNLAAITGLNSNPNAAFRIVSSFNGSGSTYNPSNSSSIYGTTGTLRYDMVTVKGTLTSCSGVASVQASNLILTKTDASTMTLAYNRGNGLGCIVIAKAGSPVDFTPLNGTQYAANAAFASGMQLGTGNFVVAGSTVSGLQQTTVTGLTSGTKYFFAIYEYSATGFCYLTPAITYSAYCNSTVLVPGDMLIVGFDAHVATNGVDKYYITNLVNIKRGTTFSLVNSRFEAATAANSRSNKWRGPGTSPYIDPDIVTFVYTGTAGISTGSIISFEFNIDAQNIQINGAGASAMFETPIDNHSLNGGFISTSGADQIYLVSGYFTPFGTNGIDKYNILTGNQLCGITNGSAWVPFSSPVSESIRESRIPPQINCISLQLSAAINGFGYYSPITSHMGTKAEIIGRFTSPGSWQYGAGLDNVNDAIAATALFTISSSPDGRWNGSANTDWFNCSNWEGLAVPSPSTDVTIPSVTNKPVLNNATSAFAAEFGRYAATNSLTINSASSVSLTGSANDNLSTFGPLSIANGGSLLFETGASADTLYLKNHFTNNGSGFTAGTGTVVMDNNFSNTATLVSAAAPLVFNNLAMANAYGATVNSGLVVNGQLRLANGIFNMGNNIFRINKFGVIAANSFDNVYAEWQNGWDGSFINGKVEREMEGSNVQRFPIGKMVNGMPFFAPCNLTPDSTDLRVYSAEYFHTTPPDKSNKINVIDHLSDFEYWEIDAVNAPIRKDAVIQLSWRPESRVTLGSLDSLLIAHYLFNGATDIWSSEAPNITLAGSFSKVASTTNPAYGTIQQGNFFASQFKPMFTLATRSMDLVLPVQLLSFIATPQNKTVQLNWQVVDEKDALSYTVEKSADARNFSFMEKIMATANVGVGKYTTTDAAPATGWNYYRLIITNKQGKTFISKTERAWMGDSKQLLVYPNPASTTLKIVLPQADATVSLLDASGKTVWASSKPAQQTINVDVQKLPRGVYLLQYRSAIVTNTQKIILQ